MSHVAFRLSLSFTLLLSVACSRGSTPSTSAVATTSPVTSATRLPSATATTASTASATSSTATSMSTVGPTPGSTFSSPTASSSTGTDEIIFAGVVSSQGSSASPATGSSRIYSVGTGGSPAHPLTAGPQDGSPLWSPDGSQIGYVTSAGADSTVSVMQADGSGAHPVFHGAPSGISWSPDGKYLAISGISNSPDAPDVSQIYVVALDGSQPRDLSQSEVDDNSAAWSPNGTQIAFLRPLPNSFYYAIFLMNADGSNQHQITGSDVQVVNLEPDWQPWSPDGRSLLFQEISFGSGTPIPNAALSTVSLDVIDADGTNLHRFSVTDELDIFPRWSPDGQQILYTRGGMTLVNPTIPAIYVVQADGTNVQRLTDGKTPAGSGAWAPDGNRIAYFGGIGPATPNGGGSVNLSPVGNLLVMNADGSSPIVVVENVAGPDDLEAGLAWRPGTK